MLPMPRFWQSTSRKVTLEFDGSGGILNIFFGTEIGCQVATGNLTNLLLILSNLPQWRSLQNTNTKEISKWQRPFQSQFPESLKHLEPVLAPNAPRCFSRPIFGTIPGCSSPRPSTQLDYTIAPGRGTPAPRPLCAPECFVFEIKFTDWRNSEQLLFSNHFINHPSKSSKDLIQDPLVRTLVISHESQLSTMACSSPAGGPLIFTASAPPQRFVRGPLHPSGLLKLDRLVSWTNTWPMDFEVCLIHLVVVRNCFELPIAVAYDCVSFSEIWILKLNIEILSARFWSLTSSLHFFRLPSVRVKV